MDKTKFNNNDEILRKYGEIASCFENLSKMFEESYELNLSNIIKYYKSCLMKLRDLTIIEKSEEIQSILMNILRDAKSQQQKIEGALLSNSRDGKEKFAPEVKRRKVDQSNRIKLTMRKPIGNGLDDIVGLENVKTILNKSVLLPLQFPSLFTGGRRPWNQILLYGPPGTGKSKIAHALACEAKVQFYSISSADILSSWVGESEKMIKDLFEYTRNKEERCIVFIDEIDSLCRQRSNKEGDHSRSVKNQLLIELDQNISYNCNSFVLCATNCPWDIDSAFMRRFQCRIYVPLPDKNSRLQIIKNQCKEINTELTEEDWKEIVNRTEGYSGADLMNVTTYAIQEPLGELENSGYWIITDDNKWMPCTSETDGGIKVPLGLVPADKIAVRNVTMKDFAKAILITPKTVTTSEIEKYKQFSSDRG